MIGRNDNIMKSKVQVITYSGKTNKYHSESIDQSSIGNFNALDDYSINVIDLSDEFTWYSSQYEVDSLDALKDFRSLAQAINISNKTKILLILPPNCYHKYHKRKNNRGQTVYDSVELKYIINHLINWIKVIYDVSFNLVFSKTETIVGDCSIPGDFIIKTQGHNIITTSDTSQMCTSFQAGNNVVFTILQFEDLYELYQYFEMIGYLKGSNDDAPDWFYSIMRFDDLEQKASIDNHKAEIEKHKKGISDAEIILATNNRFKSILYRNSDSLVEIVFEILEHMLGCDLSNFKDEKKEDFFFEKNNLSYIGEIKGIGSNVKSENVSQLERHYGHYIDEHPEVNPNNIRKLLIITHQRKKPLDDREPVHESQIKLAEGYKSLIIETTTLLDLYERFKSGEINEKECYLKLDEIGLLSI